MAKQTKCKYCKEWLPKDDAFYAGVSPFCSKDHYYRFNNERDAAKVRPASKAPGRSKTSNRVPEVPAQVRELVLEADGYTCRLCGQYGNVILHHIIYRSNVKNRPYANEPWNLISLCNEPCHLSIVHRDKAKFQPLLLGLTWLRDIYGDTSLNAYQLEERMDSSLCQILLLLSPTLPRRTRQ